MSSDIVSIRMPKEVKEKKGEVDIDWPDYLRTAIEEKIKELKKKKRAAESIDKIRNKTRYGKFDSVKSIREDRDA
jgi:predicted DNA-binding protein